MKPKHGFKQKQVDKQVFSLLQVSRSIQKTLSERYSGTYWIKAEMNKLNLYSHSGHCYPELVEKKDGKVIAQMKSILWRDDYRNINYRFLKVLNEPLKDGIKILFLASITYDPAHGLSLIIHDIDPSYTLGDIEKEKQETIKRLQTEGLFNANKLLTIPLLPQRIAIISVETSKGYADFLKVLEQNSWGYRFFHFLFPSLLQGEKAKHSIIAQLRRIRKVREHFDVVAIIRGGGGDIGLSCYNDYELAREIALFPIPVITGIGHATNETVVEMISHTNAITPTKIAEDLIQKFHNFSVPVHRAEERIAEQSRRLIYDERMRFQAEIKLFRSVTERILTENRTRVREHGRSIYRQSVFLFKSHRDYLSAIREGVKKAAFIYCGTSQQLLKQTGQNLKKESSTLLKKHNTELNGMEKNIHNMSPQNVLKRGYSITRLNGHALKTYREAKAGDTLDTILFEGQLLSVIQSSQKTSE
ncbi:exodeoxyribonuclease VII large subunit [Flavihumibacter sp. R14]|nr:exodeoxyribonuclease VII large subunit [Flavihumibacter soli]